MSDCGFCLDGYDGGVYFGMKIVRSRKRRQCCECGVWMNSGTRVAYHRGKNDSMWQSYCCLTCDEIAEAFCCNGRLFGNFWADMEDSLQALTTSCFERLRTAAAKAELQRRWMDWKFGYGNRKDAQRRIAYELRRAKEELGLSS